MVGVLIERVSDLLDSLTSSKHSAWRPISLKCFARFLSELANSKSRQGEPTGSKVTLNCIFMAQEKRLTGWRHLVMLNAHGPIEPWVSG